MAMVIASVAASPARAPDTIRCNTFSRDDIAKRQSGAIVPEYLFARLSCRSASNLPGDDVLLEKRRSNAPRHPGALDAERLREVLDRAAALKALWQDVKEARYRGIGRFPAQMQIIADCVSA